MILAGDIGGTKAHLALLEPAQDRLVFVRDQKFESKNYSALEEVLAAFLGATRPAVQRACFGIPGPVKEGISPLTNLPWVVNLAELKRVLGLDSVWLINDLAALACSIPFLREADVEVLQTGEALDGRAAVLAAGTGMGQAFLMPVEGNRFLVIDTEGGHCDFAPKNKEETELLLFLSKKFGRVSIERLLSGPGLYNIYRFISASGDFAPSRELERELMGEEPGGVVAEYAMRGKSVACEKALRIFISVYGSLAGNLALQVLARGGVYIGGGIAPRMVSWFRQPAFMEAFRNKGRFRSLMETIPVKMILNDKAPLLGAAHYALDDRFSH